eukprot:288089_1
MHCAARVTSEPDGESQNDPTTERVIMVFGRCSLGVILFWWWDSNISTELRIWLIFSLLSPLLGVAFHYCIYKCLYFPSWSNYDHFRKHDWLMLVLEKLIGLCLLLFSGSKLDSYVIWSMAIILLLPQWCQLLVFFCGLVLILLVVIAVKRIVQLSVTRRIWKEFSRIAMGRGTDLCDECYMAKTYLNSDEFCVWAALHAFVWSAKIPGIIRQWFMVMFACLCTMDYINTYGAPVHSTLWLGRNDLDQLLRAVKLFGIAIFFREFSSCDWVTLSVMMLIIFPELGKCIQRGIDKLCLILGFSPKPILCSREFKEHPNTPRYFLDDTPVYFPEDFCGGLEVIHALQATTQSGFVVDANSIVDANSNGVDVNSNVVDVESVCASDSDANQYCDMSELSDNDSISSDDNNEIGSSD